MAGGAGVYTIKNNQNADTTFVNSDGNLVTLVPGSTGVYSISAATWASLVPLLGASNVVAQVANPTYKYAVLGLSPVATPQDVLVIQGSATFTVNITKIRLSSIGTTAGSLAYTLVRRSTQGTGGTLTAIAPALTDTTIPAATAVVSTVGTSNISPLGTQNPTGGLLEAGRIASTLTASAGGDWQAVNLRYSDVNDQPLKLRGTSDFIMLNLGGQSLAGGNVLDINIETYEDHS